MNVSETKLRIGHRVALTFKEDKKCCTQHTFGTPIGIIVHLPSERFWTGRAEELTKNPSGREEERKEDGCLRPQTIDVVVEREFGTYGVAANAVAGTMFCEFGYSTWRNQMD